ncbi:hypothetical protein EJ02DRAFT_341179 [Clathrospora elynae]|uniref:Transcription factor domain-containing protein n=1 Tax=Clathrospora elynae TaxID=706981 RepID=A0A6A5SUJ6_9PLEO|nr:hypothetical protein EJ02DRAFT_341179 [Clathrospora elynae]
MDLLQGLIVSIAWSTYFTHGKQFMGAMCGLARSLVNDIRLDKPVNSSGCPSIGPPGHVENKEARTNEGSKALLAVFTLSAYISMAFRSDPMAWSTQIEEACDMLSKNIESERDDILVTTARLARIVLSATEISRRALDDPTTAQYAMMAIEPLKLTLSTFKSTLTPGYHQHRSIISLIHSAEVSIYELALSQPPSPTSLSPYNQLPLDLKRIEYLTALLQTCKASKDHFLAGGLASITVPSMLIFPYCIKILHRLSTFKDVPGWDPTIVKQTVDIMQCLEQAAAMAERLNANFKEGTGENSIFAAAAENLRASAHNWSVPVSSEQDEGVGDSASFGTWNGGDGVDFPMADFSDDFWLPGTFNF